VAPYTEIFYYDLAQSYVLPYDNIPYIH